MEPDLRRQVTWVALIAIVASLLVFAAYRRNELDLLRSQIGTGRPDQRLAAVETLVAREKLGEALQDNQPRWVQDNVVEALGRLGTPEALFQLTSVIYLLDDPVAARAKDVLIRYNRLAIGPLVKALKDKDGNIRAGANDPLIAIGPPVSPTLVPLMDAWDQYVRDGVVAVFGAIGATGVKGASVAQTCINIVEQVKPATDQTPQRFLWKRNTAVRSLIAMKAAAMDPIIKQLFTYKDDEVRALAAQTLGTIVDQAAVPPLPVPDATKAIAPLLALVNNDKAWIVRRKAATALGGVGKIPGQPVVPALVAHLSDPQPEVRAASAGSLGLIGDPATAGPLVNTLVNNRRGAVREIVVALEKIGAGALPATVPALANPDREVREAATEAVAVIGTAGAVEPLANMLKDPLVSIRRRASDALIILADARVTGQLVGALADPDWHVYYAARDALAKVGPPAVPALVSALASTNSRMSHMAEQALSRIGAAAVPALVADLASQESSARGWAAVSLGDIGADSVAALSATIADMSKPAYVRCAAADALGRTLSPFAMKPLLGAVRQPEPEVRQIVEAAMVRLALPEATPVLVAGLQDPSAAVRETSMKLLIDWHLGETVKLLDGILASNDANARRRAAIVMAYQKSATAHELVNASIRGLSKEAKSTIDIVPILTEAVSDLREDNEVRIYAVHSLGYLGDERALAVLGQLLRPTDPLASEAARSVAMIGRAVNESKVKTTEEVIVRRHPPSSAGATLIDLLLTTTDPKLRMDAAVALSLMGDDPVFGIIDKFQTANDDMKLWLAAVLGSIGKPASDAAIDERGSNKNATVKEWTTISLALVGEADAQAQDVVKHLPPEEQPDRGKIAAGKKVLEQIRAARAGTA